MDIIQFAQYYPSALTFQDSCLLWHINPKEIREAHAPFIDLHLVIVLARGSMRVVLDNCEYLLSDYCQVDCDFSKKPFQIIDATDDTAGLVLALSQDYIVHTFNSRPPFRPEYVDYKLNNLATPLLPSFCNHLMEFSRIMEVTFKDTENHYLEQLINEEIRIFYMGMADYFEREVIPKAKELAASSHQCVIFTQFMKLLSKEALREHSVTYYADRLCITQQYLSRICRATSGHSAYELVSNAVVGEIKRLLMHQELSLQQIVREMNFSDQSVFTKFFKRMTGQTPMQYRSSK